MRLSRRMFLRGGVAVLGGAVLAERGVDYASESTAKAKIVIVGGGTAGITVAAQLYDKLRHPDITIIEPSDAHHYQPGYTLIAADIFTPESVVKPTSELIPGNVKWVKDSVAELVPDKNQVLTAQNGPISYDFLVLAAGCQMNFGLIQGITRETLGEGNAHCIYDFQGAAKCRDAVKKLKEAGEGRLVFANTYTKLKCGGAPKKICLLTEDLLRDNGRRDRFQVEFFAAGGELMKPAAYGKRLEAIFSEREIAVHLKHRLVSVDTAARKASFQVVEEATNAVVPLGEGQQLVEVDYELLHFAPPMSAPDFVHQSPIATTSGSLMHGGWAEVDKETLLQPKFPNIVILGDVAGIPASKTGAAIRVQAPVAVANLIARMEDREPLRKYNGYSACPIITEYGKVLMCEFGYDDKLMPSIPWLDPTVERELWWMVKVHGLKPMYFQGMLRGFV